MCSRVAQKPVEVSSSATPLRSVENRLDYSGPASPTPAHKKHHKVVMEVAEDRFEEDNSNCAVSAPKIMSEPFLDNYTVEQEIGR